MQRGRATQEQLPSAANAVATSKATGIKAITWKQDNHERITTIRLQRHAPQVCILRLLLEAGDAEGAKVFIKNQRGSAVMSQIVQVLRNTYEDEELVSVAEQRLTQLDKKS